MRTYQEWLDLFISVHGRKPIDGDEFSNWIEFAKANFQTTNSRGLIS